MCAGSSCSHSPGQCQLPPHQSQNLSLIIFFYGLKTPSPSGLGVEYPTLQKFFSPSSLQVSPPGWARFGAAEQRDGHRCQLLGDAFWTWHQPGPGSGCVPAPGLLQDNLWRTPQTGDHNPSWEHCVLHSCSSVREQVLNRVCTDQHHGKCRIREKRGKWGFFCGY